MLYFIRKAVINFLALFGALCLSTFIKDYANMHKYIFNFGVLLVLLIALGVTASQLKNRQAGE